MTDTSTKLVDLAALIAEKANDARDVFDGTCDTAKQSVDYFEQLLLAALSAATEQGHE